MNIVLLFSLRALITASGLVPMWLQTQVEQAYDKGVAIYVISDAGGLFVSKADLALMQRAISDPWSGLAILKEMNSPAYVIKHVLMMPYKLLIEDVAVVQMQGERMTPEMLRHVQKLPGLQKVYLWDGNRLEETRKNLPGVAIISGHHPLLIE